MQTEACIYSWTRGHSSDEDDANNVEVSFCVVIRLVGKKETVPVDYDLCKETTLLSF